MNLISHKLYRVISGNLSTNYTNTHYINFSNILTQSLGQRQDCECDFSCEAETATALHLVHQ